MLQIKKRILLSNKRVIGRSDKAPQEVYMKISIKQVMIAVCLCMCLSGCGKKTENSKAAPESNTEVVSENKNLFPESYSEQTEKIKFECQLEIPENFDASNFHVPVIKGVTYIEPETVYSKYVEGQVVIEEYHDEPTSENQKVNDTYILEDGTLIGIDGGFIYYTPKASIYGNVVRASERSAPKDDFLFATGDSCVEQVKEELKVIGCPVDEFEFGWFSTSGEDYAILEQRAVDDGMLDSQNVNPDGWTEADNAYEIYGWQTYEGLPVFPPMMTSAMTRAIESYKKAPVSALYTEQGMLSLALTEPPYVFEPSGKASEFMAFPQIADVLIQKYNDLLDDDTYTVTRAKLALRTYFDEKQELAAEPIWYFEVAYGDAMEVVLVNAVTATEIFLN